MTAGSRTYNGLAVPLKGESVIEQETAATDILTIEGAASQSGDFLVCRDSSEAEQAYIDSAGAYHGLVIQGGSATAIAASGAIPITTLYSCFDSSGGALAMTLADGQAGQIKMLKSVGTGTNNVVVTPAHFKDGTTVTMNAQNEGVTLVFDGTDWCLISNVGAAVVA